MRAKQTGSTAPAGSSSACRMLQGKRAGPSLLLDPRPDAQDETDEVVGSTVSMARVLDAVTAHDRRARKIRHLLALVGPLYTDQKATRSIEPSV